MPSRMFAIGEEPVGIRVSPYHKPYCISKILSALDENEVKSVRVSPFRKLVEIVEKPPFSRCFGWFLMSRHLKISKKHEGNSNGIGDDTVPLPDEYTAEEAPVGAEDASGVGEDMIDVNMTAVNNLNEHSSTGVVNNPTSPLVDRDANTTVNRGLFFPMATNLSTKKYQFMPQTMILLCRHIEKSKPAKVIPRALVGEYQCDKQFLTRAWEAHVTALCSSPNNDYAAKFRSLSEKLKSPFDINVGGLSLESRELSLIIERSSYLSAKV
ncbi:hypothetical protein F2Q70_00030240 [Brassica cretica]|uniref:Uncharacterized protein n=1 Tax=Brassica cretica TaxID=69181 RepID=A0A8S9FEK7_BRACR|nr:hypothetical protein F2Q70_00030240 [Brassica cretica]